MGELDDSLNSEERRILLAIARQALEESARGEPLSKLDLENLPPHLIEPGATFVTLTINKELRGCIGALEATQPLAEDVRIHAVAAGLEDYRFPPVQPDELPGISIEISRLTAPQLSECNDAEELLKRLRPGVDGVVLKEGNRRATFLPQVWDKVPEPEKFLSMLCKKMGAPPDYWRGGRVEIFTYQVEEFHE